MNALNGVQSNTDILQIISSFSKNQLTKNFGKELDFKGIKLPVKVRDIHKIEKKKKEREIPIGISVFGYKNKEKHPFYESFCEEKHVD